MNYRIIEDLGDGTYLRVWPLPSQKLYSAAQDKAVRENPLRDDQDERRKIVELAIGRIFALGSRPTQPGDVEEYNRCRAIILNATDPTKYPGQYPPEVGPIENPIGSGYPKWRATYSNEAFDRAQALAQVLTDLDRKAGRAAPAYGYSDANFKEAERIVRAAQTV